MWKLRGKEMKFRWNRAINSVSGTQWKVSSCLRVLKRTFFPHFLFFTSHTNQKSKKSAKMPKTKRLIKRRPCAFCQKNGTFTHATYRLRIGIRVCKDHWRLNAINEICRGCFHWGKIVEAHTSNYGKIPLCFDCMPGLEIRRVLFESEKWFKNLRNPLYSDLFSGVLSA